jgi:hypothetical protein
MSELIPNLIKLMVVKAKENLVVAEIITWFARDHQKTNYTCLKKDN